MKGSVSIIVAMGADNAIGQGGTMPFRISADMQHFRDITMGHPVIMGSNTFRSLPKGALPGRRNIIVSRRGFTAPDAETFGSLKEAIDTASKADDEVMVIGGGEIYRQALPLATRLYLTEVDATFDGADVFFPTIDLEQWTAESVGEWQVDEKSSLRYRFVCLCRK